MFKNKVDTSQEGGLHIDKKTVGLDKQMTFLSTCHLGFALAILLNHHPFLFVPSIFMLSLFARLILRSMPGRTFLIALSAIHPEHTTGMTRGCSGAMCQRSPTITPWCCPVLPFTIGE